MAADSPNSDAPPPLSTERQEGFVRLLNEAHGLLLRYVMSLLGNRHDAEDVLQRSSVVMWRRFATFEPGTDFIAWATTVAFYEVRNFQRVTGRCQLKFDDELMHMLAAERVDLVRQWSRRTEALELCVEKLAQVQRRSPPALVSLSRQRMFARRAEAALAAEVGTRDFFVVLLASAHGSSCGTGHWTVQRVGGVWICRAARGGEADSDSDV
ncbi:MAG: RNA polymerase subunit sigma [Verrucomicrobia bacterium]|nr:RNA polymerase subunit sigma [Verrucomicrobiota bacterium]